MLSTWIVPGAPLEGGVGWRVWYSRPGHGEFTPGRIRISRAQQEEETKQDWKILPDLPGLDRRMGILTLRLTSPKPGSLYEIKIPEAESSEPFLWRTLPNTIDSDPDVIGPHGVSFLMASCFWRDNDKEGTYLAAVRQLVKQWHPAFKLLLGDQVYADWPADYLPDFTGHPEIEVYADRYAEYWGDVVYRELMQTSPNFFMCDDHEFWNDYPEKQIHLSRSLPEFRDAYAKAAQQLYVRYQQCLNPGDRPWYRFAIGEVSFFIADSRSERDFFDGERRPPRFFQQLQRQDLERWAHELRGPGVLVLGQPIFQKDGDWRDHSLSNFAEDYGHLWSIIEGSIMGRNDEGKPHDILVLSGDIHTGRFAVGRRGGLDAPEGVPELIASPASMIRPGSKEPEKPDYKFTVRQNGHTTSWEVGRNPFMTLHNNIGMVRLLRGTNRRVLFELSIYQIRPYDSRSWWNRLVREAAGGLLALLFRREIELR
ncbi:MAG: alkaline phosphatase D family protein [Deltaproteobacteria bacterium]|nr:alkaline phosphatase D family protein [Deltaproteobacteria bacterium]